MAVRYQLDTLLHYDPSHSSATVNVWVGHPSSAEEVALGKIIIISSFERLTRVNHEIIDVLQEDVRAQYYQSTDATPDRAFERALQHINQRLHEVIAQGVDQWVEGANILVAALRQQTILFSHVGQMNAFVVRQQRLHSLIAAGDRIIPNPLRMFGQVISGSAEIGDRFILCTPSLFDYFSLEKIRRLMIDSHPDEVVRQLEATILSAEPTYGLGAIVLEVEPATEIVLPTIRQQTTPVSRFGQSVPETSMETLLSRQRQTEKILTPSIWPAVVDILQRFSQAGSHFIRVVILRRQPRRKLPSLANPPTISRRPSPNLSFVRSSWLNLRRLVSTLTWSLRQRPLVSPREVQTHSRPRPSLRRWLNALVQRFQGLRSTQRVIIGIAVLIVIGFTAALAQHGATSRPAASANPEQRVQTLIGQAKAALLYGGDQAATDAVTQAEALIAQLPRRTGTQRSTREKLQSALQQLRQQLDHLTTVTTLPVALDLHGLSPAIDPRQLYLAGSTLVAFDPASGTAAFRTLSSTNAPIVLTDTLDAGLPITGGVNTTSTLIFSTDRQTFVELDLAKRQWKPLDSAYPLRSPRIQALATYQNRVYVLDTSHSDILRFVRGGSSLGTSSSWLKVSADLKAARGIAVDGTIFILQPSGRVQNFSAGRLVSFSLAAINPQLRDATRLWTDVGSAGLYLLEPSSRRLIIFDKTGRLVDQYQSSQWTDLRDLAVNEKTKTAYLLNGQTVLRLDLQH